MRRFACLFLVCLALPACELVEEDLACGAYPQAWVDVQAWEIIEDRPVQFDSLEVALDDGAFEEVTCEAGSCDDVRVFNAEGDVHIRGTWAGTTLQETVSNIRSESGCSIDNPTVVMEFEIEDGCRDDGARCD